MTRPESALKETEESPRLHGNRPFEVLDAIRARHGRWQAGDSTPDGRKIGLVVEGGGLRASVSAGGAWVLAELGFGTVFDEVYATSAGVMNASYMISGQQDLGISIWFDECTSPRFIRFARFWKVLNVDYIIDEVVARRKPLNVNKVMRARPRFSVPVIDKSTGQAFMVDVKETVTPLLDVLKAALAIPIFYNRTVEVDGRQCMDGGMGIPFPIRQALEDGCTDILVFSTRPIDHLSQPAGAWAHLMFNLACARGNAGLMRTYREHHLRSREVRELATGTNEKWLDARVATICTEGEECVSRLTRDPDVLHAAATSYGRKTMELFGHDASRVTLPR